MKGKVKTLLLALLLVFMLVGFAAAVPQGSIKSDVKAGYDNNAEMADDDYAFLLDE